MKLFLAAVLLLGALGFSVTWWLYRQWPPVLWAGRVRRRVAEWTLRREQLLHPARSQRSAAEALADELFEAQKRNVSANALTVYAGIGPKTVEALRDAGIRTLPDAEGHAEAVLFKKKVQNLGPVREQALAEAVRSLLRDERRRFDEARSPEGQDYRTRLVALGQQEQEQAAAKQREIEALDRGLNELRPLVDLARDVTIRSWMFQQGIPGLTDEVMARPLPELVIEASRGRQSSDFEAVAAAPKQNPRADVPGSRSPQLMRLQAWTRFALLMAKADGRIVAAERGRIRVVLGERFGSDPALLRHLDPQLEAAEKDLPSEADAVAAITSLTPRAEWQALYEFAESIAAASAGVSEKERQFLDRLAAAFELKAPAPVTAPEPVVSARDMLGIPAGAAITTELVRRRYNLLTEQICPEKAGQLGPEFAAMAVGKRAAIRAAAEELLKGEPLVAPAAPPPSDKLRENSDLDDLFGA